MSAIATSNILFCKTVEVLKELGSMPEAEFTKKAFEEKARSAFCASPSNAFEALRRMGLVTLVRKEDLSTVENGRGCEQDITIAEYEALPMCVKNALNWEVSYRVRHWYIVNRLALAQEIVRRKGQLVEELSLLNSL